jgi:hypothetical protein
MIRYLPVALIGGLMALSLSNDAASAQSCVGNRNMCDALMSLQQARASLQRADSNKGGYRMKAIQSVDRAIIEVREGIRYSNIR